MNFQKIVPRAFKNLLNKKQLNKNVSEKMISKVAKKTSPEPQILNDTRDYSLIAKKNIVESEEYRNILKSAIRNSSGGSGAHEYKLGHTVPGLRYMAGNQYRTTLVFTLFFLPAWWAPWILFIIIWDKQMGWGPE